MSFSKSPIIAVIAAGVNGFAEKEFLSGIISENKSSGYATVVFSNIYNIVQKNENLLCEQNIYDLAVSNDISGIILLCESFVEGEIRRRIASLLKDVKVPVVGAGASLKEFEKLDYILLNTSDIDDIYNITSHLIEEHGFTDIDMLTGMKDIETSHLRAKGYMQALETHGITPDKSRIHYGDFWLTSGEELAKRYINGEFPMPQAVVCANDIMAYGMLRIFSDNHISVPQDITVVSYEYSDMRLYYSPPLTSYRRDRYSLGKAAAKHLQCLISGEDVPEFNPPAGKFVFGSSCPCEMDKEHSLAELRSAERHRNYNDLSLFSTMEHELTICRDMDEFIHTIGNYHWLMQNKKNIYMCLYTDWCDTRSDSSEIVNSRSILYWGGSNVWEIHHHDLRTFFQREPDAAVCYFNPLFSGQKYFGYMAMLYEDAESYDDIYRHWLKSVSVGLEFLRLKNDIRYLLSCQNVSEYRDTLTGLNNEKGLRRTFSAFNITEESKLCFVMLRIDLFPRQFSDEEIRRKTEAVLAASKAITKLCGGNDISARIKDDVFVCLIKSNASCELIADLLSSMLIQEKAYAEYAGTSSFTCSAIPCTENDIDSLMSQLTEMSVKEYHILAEKRRNRYYNDMLSVRNMVYRSPELTFLNDSENIFTDRIDFFRRHYKSCFGITFHQDCINARLARAKYYLAATSLSTADIAEKCGYLDDKYLQRQFTLNTGIPLMQYRDLFKG
ncbi:MAG: substrate-binding domain-containing protein [Ruminococcus sp.]|nr:substrate-binding domain-containing protein [Ruminococcus sp.]